MNNISKIWLDDEMIYIKTDNGKVYGEKFVNYPRLCNATPQQRNAFTASNLGIHWQILDEDFTYNGFLNKEKEIMI
ncbi:MAG: DUF2442 domain-containing protein [Paludibacter sp.]|jgi:hypothetical protein|nr:DUF2442 domain-containing protein [Paludibacter sp.]